MLCKTILVFTLFAIISTNARSNKLQELKPVLIKSVVSNPRVPYNQLSSQEEDEELSSRKIYQFPAAPGHHQRRHPAPPQKQSQDEPERGQILHRPKASTGSRGQGSSQSPQNEMPNDAPIVLNGGKGKKVKYVPTMGYQGPEKPPQVYVISNSDDEHEDVPAGGVMNSMQTYFKSMTGRIRAVFQGLIGGITD